MRLGGGAHRGVEAEGALGAAHVVVDGLGHADDRQALAPQVVGDLQAAVAADGDERVESAGLERGDQIVRAVALVLLALLVRASRSGTGCRDWWCRGWCRRGVCVNTSPPRSSSTNFALAISKSDDSPPNKSVWPLSCCFCIRDAKDNKFSILASSCPLSPNLSRAPLFIRLSMVFLLAKRLLIIVKNSSMLLKRPTLSRALKISSTAPVPMFLIAARPKRIFLFVGHYRELQKGLVYIRRHNLNIHVFAPLLSRLPSGLCYQSHLSSKPP